MSFPSWPLPGKLKSLSGYPHCLGGFFFTGALAGEEGHRGSTTIPDSAALVRVNRAPVLTLWAAIVAERLGHPPDTALSLASYVAGTGARVKARRLGIAEGGDDARTKAEGLATRKRETIRLLGCDGKPQFSAPVRAYVE